MNLLKEAILKTIIYADIFDYPLTAFEIHRYLVMVPASLPQVKKGLAWAIHSGELIRQGEYFTLPGRVGIVETRDQRSHVGARLWPKAVSYGRWIASSPFVRMTALTGALAANNAGFGSDLDYFIITEAGRLWICRAWVILLVRLAARSGAVLCPNYFITENALKLPDRSLFTARELAQMVPFSGSQVYKRLREENAWVEVLLPNAAGPPREAIPELKPESVVLRAAVEATLRTPLGTRLESWEMNRKIAKFTRQQPSNGETVFSAQRCQGHFGGYRQKTMAAYEQRIRSLIPT